MLIPNDFDGLVQGWGSVIQNSGAKDILKTSYQIVGEGFLKHQFSNIHDFKIQLSRRVRQVTKEQEFCSFERPLDIPRNNTQLQASFDKVVRRAIYRVIPYNNWGEDLVQHIWAKILEVDVLTMFLSYCARKLPERLQEAEVVDYLGVTWDDWETFKTKAGIIRGPVTQAYSRDEVQAFESSKLLPVGSFPRKLPEGNCNKRKLCNYLATAVGNHARNYLRTQSRRFSKENTLNTNVCLSSSGVGSFITHTLGDEDSTNHGGWEATLPDMKSTSMDVVADVRLVAGNFGYDLETETGFSDFMSKLQKFAKKAKTLGLESDSVEFSSMFLSETPAQMFSVA